MGLVILSQSFRNSLRVGTIIRTNHSRSNLAQISTLKGRERKEWGTASYVSKNELFHKDQKGKAFIKGSCIRM